MARYVVVAAALLVLTAATLAANGYEKTAEEGTSGQSIFDGTEESRHTDTGEDAKQGKDGSESWTGWAKDKIQEGLGLRLDDRKQDSVVDQTTDHVKDGVGKAQSIMSETGRSASVKAGEYKDAAAGKASEAQEVVSDKAGSATEKVKEAACDAACKAKQKAAETTKEASEAAKQKGAEAAEGASKKATEAKEKAYEGAEYAKRKAEETKDAAMDKAKEGYQTVKKKAEETLEGAKDTVNSNHDEEDDAADAEHKTQEMKRKVGSHRGGGWEEEL